MKLNINQLLEIRSKYLTDKQFVNILAGLVGLTVGLAAVVIKNSVYLIQQIVKMDEFSSFQHYFYFVYPLFGILLVVIFMRKIIKIRIEHGIPSVLYSISETKGHIKPHNTFSSIIGAAITVGFGGSVGLEGPTVATGAAYGSAIGRIFRLNYKQTIILLGAASTGAMAAIFKAPIAGIVFAMEVIMIDLTVGSVLPLLISAVVAVLTSYLFLGSEFLYHFNLKVAFEMSDLPLYVLMGILAGLVSVYFTKVYIFIQINFKKIKNDYYRLLVGGIPLGILIFIFPALYGEGYEVINLALTGHSDMIWESSVFNNFATSFWMISLIILGVILMKSFATSLTLAVGGIGGIFAPTLFLGALTGLLFASILNQFNISIPVGNFALVAMAGTIAGVLQAPLTAIFLIAEISGGYHLLVPLMLVSVISYITTRAFITNSVYTYQLAQRGQLMTHHADKNTLKLIDIESIIEKDFLPISPKAYLSDLVKIISSSNRSVFPVVDENGNFLGVVHFSWVRQVIFNSKLLDKVKITEYISHPDFVIKKSDTMESIAKNLTEYQIYNIPVVENGKYIGFISRANFFAEYRKTLKEISED
jgi:chloride channel protein, CIC family